MLTLGLKMMGTNNIVYQLTIWILHGQLIILFINSTDCNNLNTFFTLCLPGSRLNDEMLLLFFHLYTSERDPQDLLWSNLKNEGEGFDAATWA